MDFLIRLFVSAVAVILSAYILPGVSVRSFWTALWVALILTFECICYPDYDPSDYPNHNSYIRFIPVCY